MKRFVAAAGLLAIHWQSAYAQMILGSIPEEYQGHWCLQENTQGVEVFKTGDCKLKPGYLTIDRMTLDRSRLSCAFDSGTADDDALKMRMLCTSPEDKQSSIYGAQIKLLPGKRIELINEPTDQQ